MKSHCTVEGVKISQFDLNGVTYRSLRMLTCPSHIQSLFQNIFEKWSPALKRALKCGTRSYRKV